MRIRKHARISSLSLSHASIAPCALETLQTHVCELNRSPWDVMAFAPQSDFSYPHEYQVSIEDISMGNSVGGQSVNAVESVSSLKWQEVVKGEEDDEEDEEEESERRFSLLSDVDKEKKNGLKRAEGFGFCNKTDGKGWKCRREAKEGHSLCDHHLTQLRSYHYNYSQSSRKSDDKKPASVSRRRNRGRDSKSASPSDFYYYSGFGPLWGKKRETKGVEKDVIAAASARASPSSHVDLDLDLDHVDDDDSNGSDSGKKRARKPIKARSLKSLL